MSFLYLLIWGEGGLKTSEALLEILLTYEHFCRPKKVYFGSYMEDSSADKFL